MKLHIDLCSLGLFKLLLIDTNLRVKCVCRAHHIHPRTASHLPILGSSFNHPVLACGPLSPGVCLEVSVHLCNRQATRDLLPRKARPPDSTLASDLLAAVSSLHLLLITPVIGRD